MVEACYSLYIIYMVSEPLWYKTLTFLLFLVLTKSTSIEFKGSFSIKWQVSRLLAKIILLVFCLVALTKSMAYLYHGRSL